MGKGKKKGGGDAPPEGGSKEPKPGPSQQGQQPQQQQQQQGGKQKPKKDTQAGGQGDAPQKSKEQSQVKQPKQEKGQGDAPRQEGKPQGGQQGGQPQRQEGGAWGQGGQQRQQGGQQGGHQGGQQQRQQGGQQGGQGGAQGGQQQRQGGGAWGQSGQQGGQQQRQQGGQGGQQGPQQQRQGQQGGQQQRQQGGPGGQQGGPGGQQGGQQQQRQGGGAWGQGGQQGGQQQRQQGGQGGQQGGQQQRQQGPQGGQQGGQQQRQQGGQGGQQGGQQQQRQGGGAWGQGGQQGGQQQRQQGPQGGQQGGQQQQRQGGGAWGQQGGQQQQRPGGGSWGQGGQGGQQQRQGGPQGGQRGGAQEPPSPARGMSHSESMQSLASQMSEMSVGSSGTSVGAARGSGGQKVKIDVNYVDLAMNKMISTAYHYDIKFDPDKPKRMLRLAFNKFRETVAKECIAFDGKANVYSPVKLPAALLKSPAQVKVLDPNVLGDKGLKEFKITLKETDTLEIDLKSLTTYQQDRIFDKPMRAVQCLDVVLRDGCFAKGKNVGRAFYLPTPTRKDLGEGFDLWLGLFQAAVLGERPLINIDVCHKAFSSEMSLIDMLKLNPRTNLNNELDNWTSKDLDSALKGFNVIYKDPTGTSRLYKYMGLAPIPSRATFMKGEQKMTVADYFAKDKSYRLQYPNMPCINVGSSVRAVYVPLELVYMQAAQTRRDASVNQVRAMIKEAATTTDVRKQKIMNLFNHFKHNSDPIISRFGLSLGRDFLSVQARIINPPKLQYQNNALTPFGGKWDLRGAKFLQPVEIIQCAIWVTDNRCRVQTAQNFKNLLLQHGPEVGINMADNVIVDTTGYDQRNMIRSIDTKMEFFKQKQVKVVFVVLSGNNYANIKQSAELRLGVLTQCVKTNTLERRTDASTMINILLKVNAKLNGINQTIDKRDRPNVLGPNVMLMGADVTHPAPNSFVPSVVGVTASHDPNFFQFNICYRIQDPRMEMIKDMQDILTVQLEYYKRKQGRYPENIIYYRDGVSEGQFEQLRKIELHAMDRACSKIPGKKPLITCIVVQKRHHTRFFPDASVYKRDRFHNCPPGTIVDSVITHPNECQFFLLSHESIQGTAKPTKYCVTRDDAQFNIDALQAASYHLCHMFARCNRAVSYPAPTYYAHLVAARGKAYTEGARLDLKNLDREYTKRIIRDEIQIGHPMFFV